MLVAVVAPPTESAAAIAGDHAELTTRTLLNDDIRRRAQTDCKENTITGTRVELHLCQRVSTSVLPHG